MKTKRVLLYLCIGACLAGIMSSCAIDRKCPAYTKASTESIQHPS